MSAPAGPVRLAAAVVGLGEMGRGIARRLDRAGLLVAAWDVSSAARETAALSAASRGPAALGALADVVLLVVPSSREIATLIDGADGLLAAPRPGQVLVDLTTSDPTRTRDLAARAVDAGRCYLDCGMSGGAAGAASGQLSLMVGGDAAVLARIRPVLDTVASRILHVGPSGAGHTVKLIHNMVCHTNFLALCEAGRLAERAGIDLPTLIGAVNAGNARSFVSERRFPDHVLSGSFDGRSRVANLAKDLGMVRDLARCLGTVGPYGELAASLLDSAVAAGHRDEDFTTLYRSFDELPASGDGATSGETP